MTTWVCNSERALQDCIDNLRQQWHTGHYYLIVKAKSGKTRTLDQNSLLHIWCRQLVAHCAKIPEREVTAQQTEDMKTSLKRGYYRATGNEFVLRKVVDSLTGEAGSALRSSTEYETGQMFDLMEWVQAMAITDLGLLLESSGEYAKYKSWSE